MALLDARLGFGSAAHRPFRLSEAFAFRGRVGRRWYWTAKTALLLGSLATAGGLRLFVSLLPARPAATLAMRLFIVLGAGSVCLGALLFLLALVVADVSAGVRRWHDRGRSGWWVLIGFAPVLGWTVQGVECGSRPGQPGANRFGPEPAP